MDMQARQAKENMKKLPTKDKIVNFWFYYKIHTIIGIVILCIILNSIIAYVNKHNYDLSLQMYTSFALDETTIAKIENVLTEGAIDTDNNGSIDINISPCVADITCEPIGEMGHASLMKILAELSAHDTVAYIVDESYKILIEENYLDTINNITKLEIYTDVDTEFEELYLISFIAMGNRNDDEKFMNRYRIIERIEKNLAES